jgi:LAGLIDADG endonuclease
MSQPNVMFRAIPREGQHTLRALDASYVAGFLDGDGSIHFQLVRQKEYRFGYYIRASVSFSQSTSARFGLEIIQRLVGGGGYMRDRGTGMSDLVITSRPLLLKLLSAVEPYVIFKREHVRRALLLIPRLDKLKDPEEFLRLAREVDAFATLNYSKSKRISAADVEQHLRSKGVLCPCNDFLARHSEGMASSHTITDAMTRRPLEIG